MSDSSWDGKFASRKFVDLIWKSSSKWAVWEPASVHIAIGDYGTVNRETGHFEREGNVFKNPEFSEIVKKYEANIESSTEDINFVTSLNARKVKVTNDFKVEAPVAQVSLKCGWEFGQAAGAVLVAPNPTHKSFPWDLDLKQLSKHPALAKKCLVTNITTCPAFALYLASKENSGLSLALCAKTPLLPSAGAETSMEWVSDYGGGLFRSGTNNINDQGYTVLFTLKRCGESFFRRWFRDDDPSSAANGADELQDAGPPWGILDEAGEEETLDLFADIIVT